LSNYQADRFNEQLEIPGIIFSNEHLRKKILMIY